MKIVKAMGITAKGLKGARSKGGYFYFIGDPQGNNAALMVYDKDKDADGKKSFRAGKGLLADFKKEFGKALYSQGEISVEGKLIFSITKGNAKPSIMKRAFKTSNILKEGIGNAGVSLLKSAKIKMAGAEPAPVNIDTTEMEAFRQNPQYAALLEGLSEEEIAEVFLAEKAFAENYASLPSSQEEATELEEQQAETEKLITEIEELSNQIADLDPEDRQTARELENQLNAKRMEIALQNPIGTDMFDEDQLTGVEKELFSASIHVGLELLFRRLMEVQDEVEAEQIALDNSENPDKDEEQERINALRADIAIELDSIEQQLGASTSSL